MFRSQKSGKQYDPGVKPVMVVTVKREKAYRDEKGFTIARGWEIVEEKMVGPDEVEEILSRGVKIIPLPIAKFTGGRIDIWKNDSLSYTKKSTFAAR